MLTRRATRSLIERSESSRKPSLREAKKWWEISTELYPRESREAFTMLGILAYPGCDVCDRWPPWKSSPGESPEEAERLLRSAIAAEAQGYYFLLDPAAYALDAARAELARVLVRLASGADDEQANAWLDEAEALVRGVLAHGNQAPCGVAHPQRTAAVVFAEIAIKRGPESSLSEALAFLDAVPDSSPTCRFKMKESFYRDGTWFYASAMVHKRLAGSRRDEHLEHAQLAVRHTLTAMGTGHSRAAFDAGVMAEEGFGATVDLTRAYVAYILGCMARDERAIAKVRELRANMSAPFFVALGTAHDRGILTEARVRGNETLEDLRELYLMFEPLGNHP